MWMASSFIRSCPLYSPLHWVQRFCDCEGSGRGGLTRRPRRTRASLSSDESSSRSVKECVCSTSPSPAPVEGVEKRCLNSELWHACAGPLVCLPTAGTRVVYFPQGHSEQVVASTNKEVEGHIPNYPSLPPQLFCQLHKVTMHADAETDEVYAQMTLQPLNLQEQKDAYFPIEMDVLSKQPTNYFCKTLTASDTSTHGGFSVPRRAAEKDFSQQPPAQELVACDLHDVEWKFRHIYRGQPKRHLLTTGWSIFVSAKRLVAGDSVLFIWNEKNQLLLGIRRSNRPQTVMPSSFLSSDSMHIGLLAAAAHAAATNSRFTVFYNPRASPSEFVIPLSKYVKAVYHTRVSVGMRFRMLFETEECSVRRYMGTITGISDLDPVRWPNSHWRSVKVGWDESTAGERHPRVSLWEIEPLTTFPMYPSLFPLRFKRPLNHGIPFLNDTKEDELNALRWALIGAGNQGFPSSSPQSLGVGPWMQQRNDSLLLGSDINQYQAMTATALESIRGADVLKQQLIENQQPFQFIQQPSSSHLLPIQDFQLALQQNIFSSHTQRLLENQPNSAPCQHAQRLPNEQPKPQAQQAHACAETFQISTNHVQQQSSLPSQIYERSAFPDSNLVLSSNSPSSSVHGILGSYSEAKSNMWNSSQLGHSISQQPLGSKGTMPGVTPFDTGFLLPSFVEKGDPNCIQGSPTPQIHPLFGVSKDPSSLLSIAAPNLTMNATVSDSSNTAYVASSVQNSLYGYLDKSSKLPQNSGEIGPQSQTFVKVCKSGSVGRSLDISRFSNYDELRMELGHMFGIEGLFENPHRSGWQLVFVDRENDVLLLGDDPWESFVNNVWCIKILSPDDVQQMGKQESEST
ncbi:auxin response factor 12-like isoform X2 [Zingiber officinale]|uniref:auxin response factor 12-like isoform X2 n=1 Tax=Zingiber officinale TaxID=94328 RepID=UPI001C4B5D0D|nr:auxin response factor 12-like isoform X2 [Zingiber officinale]